MKLTLCSRLSSYGETVNFNLDTNFANDGTLSYTIAFEDPSIASIIVPYNHAFITGLAQGNIEATVCAYDNFHPPVCQTFEVTVIAPAP